MSEMVLLREHLMLPVLFMSILMIGLTIRSYFTHRRIQQDVNARVIGPYRRRGNLIRMGLRLAGFLSCAFALLGPAWGDKPVSRAVQQRDVILAVDYSRSMLAEDIAPNRLVRVQDLIRSLFAQYPEYRYGLILFAGEAYVRIPYTYDRGYILDVLEQTSVQDVQPQGTDLKRPLEKVLQMLHEREKTTIILISDGEHQGRGSPLDLIGSLRDAQMRVISVAVGQPEGAVIPLPEGGHQKDENGELVFSQPDRQLLKTLADQTNGQYTELSDNATSLNILGRALATVEATQGESRQFNSHIDRSGLWILAGLLLLILSFIPVTLAGGSVERRP